MIKKVVVNGDEYDLECVSIDSENYNYALSMKVEEYRRIVETPGFDHRQFDRVLKEEKICISLRYPPEDALTKADIGKMAIEEIVKRVNHMAEKHKHLIYMYANGYAFEWSFFGDLMEFMLCHNRGSKQNPVYVVTADTPHSDGRDLASRSSITSKIIELDHGWHGDYKHKSNYTLDEKEEEIYMAMLGGYSQQDRNKILKEVIVEGLIRLKEYQDSGKLTIKYKDIKGRVLNGNWTDQ